MASKELMIRILLLFKLASFLTYDESWPDKLDRVPTDKIKKRKKNLCT